LVLTVLVTGPGGKQWEGNESNNQLLENKPLQAVDQAHPDPRWVSLLDDSRPPPCSPRETSAHTWGLGPQEPTSKGNLVQRDKPEKISIKVAYLFIGLFKSGASHALGAQV